MLDTDSRVEFGAGAVDGEVVAVIRGVDAMMGWCVVSEKDVAVAFIWNKYIGSSGRKRALFI